MDLFSGNQIINLLPYDGTVFYYGTVIPQTEANQYFNQLYNTIEWRNDEAIVFGKQFITSRKVAWYGTEEYSYSYSNTTKKALPWTIELLALKMKLVKNLKNSSLESNADDADQCDFAQRAGCAR